MLWMSSIDRHSRLVICAAKFVGFCGIPLGCLTIRNRADDCRDLMLPLRSATSGQNGKSNLWMVNLFSKTARHGVDPGPTFNCRQVIFANGRRGLATNLHELGVPDKVTQAILRHEDVSTTQEKLHQDGAPSCD
jgi:hypothetical protein